MPAKKTTKKTIKKQRPSGVKVTMTKGGGFRMRAFGPDAPDLRTVIPELLGATVDAPSPLTTVTIPERSAERIAEQTRHDVAASVARHAKLEDR